MEKWSRCLSSTTQTQTQAIISWIPWDLWLQILCFLPVRSLLVFRSVCKSFLSIIDDPEFVSLHLQSFPNNALETRFLTYKYNSNEEGICEVREINNVFASSPSTWNHKIIDWVIAPERFRVDPIHWNLKCSVNGLLLMYKNYSCTFVVVLWNPSIKKHRQLSLPSKRHLTFGLGHDPPSNDYKLVAFEYHHNKAWVYSVKTDTWTEILDNNNNNNRFEVMSGVGDLHYYSRGLCLMNRVFWIHYYCRSTTDSSNVDKLLQFDFETERFRYAEMPYSAEKTMAHRGLMLLDCGSSVGMWWIDAEDHVLVWALETDAMSWNLRYKLAPPHGLSRSCSRYGMAFDTRLEERNGELVCKYWDAYNINLRAESYNIDVEAQVYRMKFKGEVRDCLDIYFESLVMLK